MLFQLHFKEPTKWEYSEAKNITLFHIEDNSTLYSIPYSSFLVSDSVSEQFMLQSYQNIYQ